MNNPPKQAGDGETVILENLKLPKSYDKANQFEVDGQWYTLLLGKAEDYFIISKKNDEVHND